MQLSETVIAAMIGAVATMSTALFQLFTALRTRNKLEVRPKKSTTARSVVAVIALMAASGVGGFLYAELRREQAAEDIRSMRADINAKLQVLAAATERLAQANVAAEHNATVQPIAAPASISESSVYAPACEGAGVCTETSAPPLALCASMPSRMRVQQFELLLKSIDGANVTKAEFDQDLGGGKFSGPLTEYPQGDRTAVCVNFQHWSAQPHMATLVLHYGTQLPTEAVPAVAATATRVTPMAGPAPTQQ